MRILLRADRRLDLWAEFSTVAEAFGAVGAEAELRPRTQHSSRAWELARRTGSSRPAAAGAFSNPGLTVQDDGDRRWLARERLADYLRALQADDREAARRLLQELPGGV